MSTYSIPLSGPSPQMAWLRALIHKMAATAHAAWVKARQLIGTGAQVGRMAATTTLGVIGSPAAYDAVTNAVRWALSTGWRFSIRALGWVGQRPTALANHAGDRLAKLNPTLSRMLTHTGVSITAPVASVLGTVRRWVEATGQLTWLLVSTDLVRMATTRAAQLGTLLLAAHAVSHGTLATWLAATLPWTVRVIAVATDPARVLAFVAGTTATAMAVALARLLRQPSSQDPTPAAGVVAVPRVVPDPMETEVFTDLAKIAGLVNVEVQRDGSVIVTGIPDTVPADLGRVVAEIALDAAMRQIRRTLPVRPTPSRDDRRLFTKAARDAIRAEAQRRRGNAA